MIYALCQNAHHISLPFGHLLYLVPASGIEYIIGLQPAKGVVLPDNINDNGEQGCAYGYEKRAFGRFNSQCKILLKRMSVAKRVENVGIEQNTSKIS
jgi:hypothetical protein